LSAQYVENSRLWATSGIPGRFVGAVVVRSSFPPQARIRYDTVGRVSMQRRSDWRHEHHARMTAIYDIKDENSPIMR